MGFIAGDIVPVAPARADLSELAEPVQAGAKKSITNGLARLAERPVSVCLIGELHALRPLCRRHTARCLLYPELEQAPDEAAKEKDTYARFIAARRTAEAASVFAHLKTEEGGRYPLTGVGDVNTYALFAETIDQVTAEVARDVYIYSISTPTRTRTWPSSRDASPPSTNPVAPPTHRSTGWCKTTWRPSLPCAATTGGRSASRITPNASCGDF